MASVAPFVGAFVAPVVAIIVYIDASRRDSRRQERFRWALGVGGVTFGGFLLPFLFEDVLVRLYLHGVKSRPVVTSPREVSYLHLAVGLTVAVASVALYAIGSRNRTRRGR